MLLYVTCLLPQIVYSGAGLLDLKNWRKEGNGNLQKKDSIIEYAFYVIEPKIKPVC